MSKADVASTLKVLSEYYTVGGAPMKLNDVQASVYVDLLSHVPGDVLRDAAKKHIRTGKFFPKVSELLDIIGQQEDDAPNVLAEKAWFALEQAVGRAGAYRGAYFLQGQFGEAVRLIFGDWPHACGYDRDSPGWAMKKKSFLAIFPSLAGKTEPVMMAGMHNRDIQKAYHVPALEGLKQPLALPGRGDRQEALPVSREDAKALVGAIEAKFNALEKK